MQHSRDIPAQTSLENPWRGEVTLTINNRPHVLRLTLGALARLEAQLAAGSLVELVQRFETGRFSAADILALLTAGLEGGGYDFASQDLAAAEMAGGPVVAARVAAELLARSFSRPAGREAGDDAQASRT
jgi:hypothetical protein